MKAIALALSGVAVLAASRQPETPISFSKQVQPIFNEQCVICHSSIDPYGGLALDAKISHSQLIGVRSGELPTMLRIKPGDPDRSYLIRKLENTHLQAGGTGFRMPLGPSSTTRLSASRIAMLRKWVAEGAQEN